MSQNSSKKCNKCNTEKQISEFNVDHSKPSGLSAWCKACKTKYSKKQYKNLVTGNKACGVCHRELPIKEFGLREDNTIFSGKPYRTCTKCRQSVKNSKQNSKDFGDSGAMAFVIGAEIKHEDKSLDLLLNIKKERAGWTYQQAAYFMDGITQAAEDGSINLKKIYAQYGSGRGPQACESLFKELKQAAANKMTLKAYWQAGRPYRAGAKVILEAKRKK